MGGKLFFLGGLHAMGGILGAPEMGGSLGTMLSVEQAAERL